MRFSDTISIIMVGVTSFHFSNNKLFEFKKMIVLVLVCNINLISVSKFLRDIFFPCHYIIIVIIYRNGL